MSIVKGEEWGSAGVVPDDLVIAHSDDAATKFVTAARRTNGPIPPMTLTGGDLSRTLGGGRALTPGMDATELAVDLGAALLDGKLHWFVAHLAARQSWLRGRIVIAANGAFLGSWNIAPRAHPGDGKLDIVDADPSLRDRLAARRRLASGTHVPHPDITIRRREAMQIEFDQPTPIRLDGRPVGRVRTVSVRTEPAALRIWV
jgi:hypothetical protein